MHEHDDETSDRNVRQALRSLTRFEQAFLPPEPEPQAPFHQRVFHWSAAAALGALACWALLGCVRLIVDLVMDR